MLGGLVDRLVGWLGGGGRAGGIKCHRVHLVHGHSKPATTICKTSSPLVQPATDRPTNGPPHLSSAPLALCRPLDDPRQIQQLNFGVVVVDDLGGGGSVWMFARFDNWLFGQVKETSTPPPQTQTPNPYRFLTPGMQVSVVNSYAAASDSVPVRRVSRDDLPTDGKPGGRSCWLDWLICWLVGWLVGWMMKEA
jgi:hypothetical protein